MRTSFNRLSASSRLSAIAGVLLFFSPAAWAFDIQLQYVPGTLFASNLDGTAKATINAAAADLSAAITSTLSAVGSDTVLGSSSGTSVTIDAEFFYEHPSSGQDITISSATVAQDVVTIYVGTRNIAGNTLGVGGPGGVLGRITAASGPSSGWVGAVANAETQLNARYARGGPTIGHSSGSASYGLPGQQVPASYELDYGPVVGNLWFDIDTDNNGVSDSSTQLSDSWHFNHSSSVAAGKNDLYSVALHEILHAIGIGTADSWQAMRSGTTWYGAEVLSMVGSGANLLTADGSHIASGRTSSRIDGGGVQEVAMDPSLLQGSRKKLTWLDLAFLRDIGYDTIAPTFDPSDYDQDGDVDQYDLATLERWYGVNANADANGDGRTNAADFFAWQRSLTTGSPLVGIVPEPAAIWLLLSGIALGSQLRQRR